MLEELFDAVDAMDTDKFLSFIAEDGIFRFASAPQVQGHAAIGDAVNRFFDSIAGCKHTAKNSWRGDNSLVCEGEVCYRRHNDTSITLPFTNVFEFDAELISSYKIYIDVAPLYAE